MRWAVIFFVLFVLGFNSGFVLHAQENDEPTAQVAVAEDVQKSQEQESAKSETKEVEEATDTGTEKAAAQESTETEDTAEEPAPEKTEDEADTGETAAQEKEAKPAEEKSKEDPVDSEDTTAQEPTKTEDATDTEETKQEKSDTEETPVPKIDTVSLQEPKGNWFLKRYWWMEAERQYEKIKQIVQGILESRTSFSTMGNDLDRQVFDPFYRTVGISQGELQVTINNLIEQLEEERQEGDLSPDELKLLESVQSEKETLEELQKEVDSIVDMEGTVDEALNKLYEQINRARSYDKKAWNAFKQIARELSDSKAHELYLSIEASLKNVKGIAEYIKGSYSSYFNGLTKIAKDQVEKIKSTVEKLKEKGIDLTKKAQEYDEEDMQRAKKQQEAKEQEAIKAAIAKTKSELSLSRRITSLITTPFVWLGNIIAWPFTAIYQLVFGKKKKPSQPIVQEKLVKEKVTKVIEQPKEKPEEALKVTQEN